MAVGHLRIMQLTVLFGVLSALACGTGLAAINPTPPGGAIKPSIAAADELENDIRNQIFSPARKDFRISITDQQATSYLSLRSTNLPLENPQVWFTQGKIYLRGTLTAICLLHPDVLIVAVPMVKDKQMAVSIQQAYVGTFALPQDWIATVSQSITDSIAEARLNLDFEQAEVHEDELVIGGSKRAN
jgi:hypothetical protein